MRSLFSLMKIQFLGTGGFHPTERRQTSGVLLPEIGVAFDAGTSAFRLEANLQTEELQIFVSHAHLDHICGLTYLLVPLIQQKIRRCRVHAQSEVLTAIQQHLLHPAIFPVLPQLEWVSLEPIVEIPGGRLCWFPLHHPGGATGFRIDFDNGKSLAYVCDTYANPDSIEPLRGVDLLIHECTFPDSLSQWCEVTGHSHTSQVAKLAAEADVGQLFLTHIDPQQQGDDPLGIATAQRLFARTSIASDFLEVEL